MDKRMMERVKSIFEYNKQSLMHKDIFDATLDEYVINEYALSATASELEVDIHELRKLLS